MMYSIKAGLLIAAAAAAVFATPRASAHCDTLEGPVVKDARAALSGGRVDSVLKWIKEGDEAAVRDAFARTLAVRGQSAAAAELADLYFFETLVRLHRAGEGAPYDGLKAGSPEPLILEADAALKEGGGTRFNAAVAERVRDALEVRFKRVATLQRHANDSAEAGRDYVAAYVEFMHFAEKVSSLAEAAGSGEHHH